MELKNLPLTEMETGLKALGLNLNKILTGEELHDYIQSLAENYHSGGILPELPEADYYENQSAASFILDRRDISVTRIIRYMPSHWFTCDYFELYFLFSGESVVHFEDEGIRLGHGSVLLVAPGTLHATLCNRDDTVLLSFNIRRENFNTLFWNTLSGHDLMDSFLRRAFASDGNKKQYLHFETGEDTELQALATRIFEESKSDRAYSSQMMNALMSTFFALLLRGYESTVRFPAADTIHWKPEYGEIIDYIERNFKTVTIKELSKRFHYSERQIARIVKNSTGQHFSVAVANLNMQYVCQLLQYTNLSTEKIAEEAGYLNLPSFHRAFQRRMGTTPNRYRHENAKNCSLN